MVEKKLLSENVEDPVAEEGRGGSQGGKCCPRFQPAPPSLPTCWKILEIPLTASHNRRLKK